ncbi:MAG: xanthine dehydrogenase family protein molybdopterin-binding subunit [Candidatus Promineifilaceae bacterium]
MTESDRRIDAPGKASGRTLFPGDLSPDELLQGKVLFSNKPHARMVSMDISAASEVPGVVSILTARDVPVNEYGLILPDQPVLVGIGSSNPVGDVSLWEGDQVAVIVAENELAASRARDLVRIEWEDLPIVNHVFEAMQDVNILHPEKATNILQHYKIRKGDIDAGWAKADIVVEGSYRLPYQEHAFLQPEAGLGYIDDLGRVTVEIAGQWTHEDQAEVAHALNLPLDRVRIRYPAIGGAFGGREDMSLQIVLGLAVMRLGERGINRPVRIIWSREESIIGHHKRHPAYIKSKWGATLEGKVTAVEAELILDAGAYAYTSTKVLGNANLMVTGPYEIPAARVDSYAVYTNNVPGGAFRGFGGPQGAFAAECQMNKLAAALDIDPVEIRLRNTLREGSQLTTQSSMPPGVSMPEVITRCAQEAGWLDAKPELVLDVHHSPFRSLPPDPSKLRRGRGMACAFKNIGFSFGFPEGSDATVVLRGEAEIERAIVRHAGADVGQGAHTVFRQMAARSLKLPVEMVEVDVSDTASSGDSGSSSASRMTFMAGNAIRGAAELALEAWYNEERPAVGHYRYKPRATSAYDPETGLCDPNITYGYVAQIVDLVVDVETGFITIERVVCANDVGKAFNRTQIEGQIEGAVVQAYGYAVMEDLKVVDGRIQNPNLSTYLIPGVLDKPVKVESIIMEIPDPAGPWGARGMAEMPFLPLAPAIAAALYDATGVWFDELPITPERILNKLS